MTGGEPATVLSVEGDYARVLRIRHSICMLCPDPDECSDQEKDRCGVEIRAVNRAGAKCGDQVIVRLEGYQVLVAAGLVYGVPLAFMILGLVMGSGLGTFLGFSDLGSQGLGALGLLVSLVVALPVSKLIDGGLERSGTVVPVIAEIQTQRLEV